MTFVFALVISFTSFGHFSNHQTSALVREQRELIDDEVINVNTSPADAIKFISKQINDIGSVLKDDQIVKVVKRLKKMVRSQLPYCLLSFSCSFFSFTGQR